ncbi:hypothetical protein [Antrihabitans sp. YC2-6]|uniref:hypothetical protein n=1 Tax=Antrihabitans sp. YC2-6 TaxID=2799498 RepID=UPI0018F73655|nr:hypothetical protein [Antrihabitans sp. YC2-6]MBJ8344734.1 hypothetical protein [Antrihabitans sp. YC2-6]
MVCCALATLLIAWAPRLWRKLTGRGRQLEPFAPVAYRAGPGEVVQQVRAPEREDVPAPPDGGWHSYVLRCAAAAIGIYIGVVALLMYLSVGHDMAAAGAWTSRTTLLALSAIVGLSAEQLGGRELTGLPRRLAIGVALLVGGAMWLLLGLLDMHWFVLFHFTSFGDALFHGVAVAAAAAGLTMLLSRPDPTPAQRSAGLVENKVEMRTA